MFLSFPRAMKTWNFFNFIQQKVLKRCCHAVLLNWAVLNLHIGLEANSSWLRLHFGNMPFYLFFTFLCFFHMAYLTNSSIKVEKFCYNWAQRKKEGKEQLPLFPQHFQNLFLSLSYHLSQMTPEGLPTASSYNKTHATYQWSINEQQRGTAKLPKKLNKSTMLQQVSWGLSAPLVLMHHSDMGKK